VGDILIFEVISATEKIQINSKKPYFGKEKVSRRRGSNRAKGTEGRQ
jgi:hypothetical protein